MPPDCILISFINSCYEPFSLFTFQIAMFYMPRTSSYGLTDILSITTIVNWSFHITFLIRERKCNLSYYSNFFLAAFCDNSNDSISWFGCIWDNVLQMHPDPGFVSYMVASLQTGYFRDILARWHMVAHIPPTRKYTKCTKNSEYKHNINLLWF